MAVVNFKAAVEVSLGRAAIVVGGSLRQIIKQMFASGEQGFAYDIDDLTTMFQDAAGTVPVTGAGQAVGLMLDKSKGLVLGVEKKSSGSIALSGSAPAATYNTSTGVGTCSRIDAANQSYVTFTGLVAKHNYISITNTGGVDIYVRPSTGIGSVSYTVTAGTTLTSRLLAANGAFSVTSAFGYASFTVNSVRELAGNHAYQTQSAMRPLLVASPQRLDFDTVDDKLTTTLPAQLTGCTVIRAVPNVGTQILTGQTIPATYSDNTDHCGLIVVNRALTPSETSAITTEFNKRAGV